MESVILKQNVHTYTVTCNDFDDYRDQNLYKRLSVLCSPDGCIV
jgi:hypothetical protein